MSSSGSGSLPSRVTSTAESTSEDDSLLLSHIRRLPLPSVPTAPGDAPTPGSAAHLPPPVLRSGGPPIPLVPGTAVPIRAPTLLNAVSAGTHPRLATPEPALHTALDSSESNSAARIPPPRAASSGATGAAGASTHSLMPSMSSSTSRSASALLATVAAARENDAAPTAAAADPPVLASPPSMTSNAALSHPGSQHSAYSVLRDAGLSEEAASTGATPAAEVGTVPLPLPARPALPLVAAPADAVATAALPLVLPAPPRLQVPAPSASIGSHGGAVTRLVPLVPPPASLAVPTVAVSSPVLFLPVEPPITADVIVAAPTVAGALVGAATPSVPAGEAKASKAAEDGSKPRHLRRVRDPLENVDGGALFSAPATDGSPSSSSSCSAAPGPNGSESDDEEGEEAFVGRTRRVGETAGRERQRLAALATKAAAGNSRGEDRQSPHHHHRGKTSTHHKHKRRVVIRLHEVEGKPSPSASSRGKLSQSSQSTNGLSPDKVKQQQKRDGKKSRRKDKQSSTAISTADDDDSDADSDAAGEKPSLTYLSPAARFKVRCRASTKNKGPTRRLARRLTQKSVLGFSKNNSTFIVPDRWDMNTDDDAEASSESDDNDSAPGRHAGTVHFRITGAFNDGASDAKFGQFAPPTTDLLSPLSDSRTPKRTHRQDAEGVPKVSPSFSSPAAAAAAAVAADTVLAVTIRGMSMLHADVGVVHPFVRAWLVSCVTGESLVEAPAAVPCAVTHPFDMRAHKSRTPWWEATVALRISGQKLRGAASDAMVLLEVLDFGNETIHGFPLLRAGLYPVCWGFLLLRDCTGRSTLTVAENVHVQLYRYPQRTPWYLGWLSALLPTAWSAAGAHLDVGDLSAALGGCRSLSGVGASGVPGVYHVFYNSWNRKIPYEGSIVVTLRQYADAHYIPDVTEMLPYEAYLLSMLVSGGGCCAVPRSAHADADSAADEERGGGAARIGRGDRLQSSVASSAWGPAQENYYRMDGERSLLPQEVLQTTAVMGTVTCVSFAHNGTLVALGVYRHLQYVVELHNPLLPNMPTVATLVGHTGHVHRIVFQKEDRYLLSCSSDGTVRVWQPAQANTPFSADACYAAMARSSTVTAQGGAGVACVQCVCTLPHGFPIYAAIFHQEKIIAGGFSDQLYVWGYERALEGELPSLVTADEASLHLTATFTPELQVTQGDAAADSTSRVLLGELVYRADGAGTRQDDEEPTITLSLASNERSNRAWSVHANGVVVCWRAVGEAAERGGRTGGGRSWQMSIRHTADCAGAAEVQVSGSYALVVCSPAPLVYVFDATTCEQLRVVNTRLPPATPVSLLPDGEAFVGAVGDPSRLTAWECFDGGLCTAATGYTRAATLYGVARMAWAESQQLAVMVSKSPCTEEDRVRFLRGVAPPAPGQSPAAYYYAQEEARYRLEGMPIEMTLLTVAGTVRRRATVIQTIDRHASEAFCALYGGDMKAKRKSEYLAQRKQASRQRESDRDNRRARLHQESLMAEPASALAAATVTNIPYDATEKGARMNAIVNFWRGLVGQHKHGAEELRRSDERGTAFSLHSPPKPTTRRALRYLEAEDADEEGDGEVVDV